MRNKSSTRKRREKYRDLLQTAERNKKACLICRRIADGLRDNEGALLPIRISDVALGPHLQLDHLSCCDE